MKIKKNNFYLLIFFFAYLSIIYSKNFIFCDLYFGKCIEEPYGGDLRKYLNGHYNDSFAHPYGFSLYLIFYWVHSWLKFQYFLIIFQLTFYSVIFFSGFQFLKNFSVWKFTIFTFVIIFYPIYEGYSLIALKQGLGIIFMILSIFLVKKIYSLKSLFLILASIMSHYVFLLFYIVLYISKFLSIKLLTYFFIICVLGYTFKFNGILFYYVREIFEPLHQSMYHETWLRINPEVKYSFVVFSFFPLLLYQNIKFRTYADKESLFKILYKFHLLYCAIIFLFFSEFYYINRFLVLSWIFYPFYLLIFLNITKLYFKSIKRNPQN